LSKPRQPRKSKTPPAPPPSRLKRALLGGTALSSRPWRQALGDWLWLLAQGVTLTPGGGAIRGRGR
jgi:hypothetical protein